MGPAPVVERDTEFEALLSRAENGDADALARLNDRYLPTLIGFSRSRGAADPELVANQALFDGLRSIGRLRVRSESSFRSYLISCAANQVRSEHRKAVPISVPLDPNRHGCSPQLDPAERYSGPGWLEAAIDDLPREQRAVILERFTNGSTIGETAVSLDKTPDAVKHLQARALDRLRRYAVAAGIAALAIVVAVVLIGGGPAKISTEPAADPSDPAPAPSPEPTAVGGGVLGSVAEVPDANRSSGPAAPVLRGTPDGASSTAAVSTEAVETTDGVGPSTMVGSSEPEDRDPGASGPGVDPAPTTAPVPTSTPVPTTAPSLGSPPTTVPSTGRPPTTVPSTGRPPTPGPGVCAGATVALSPDSLWPANNRLVEVTASLGFPLGCPEGSATVELVSVTATRIEAEAGDVVGAALGTDDRAFSLRARRDGSTTASYLVTWVVTGPDGIGATVSAEVGADQRSGGPARG